MLKRNWRRAGWAAAIVAVLLISACAARQGSPETPAPSVSQSPSPSAAVPSESSQAADKEHQKLIDSFIQQASSSGPADELLQALERSVAGASPSEADEMIRAMNAYYSRNLPEVEKKFQEDRFQKELFTLRIPVTQEQIDKLKNKELLTLIRQTTDGGYKLDGAEGMIFPVVDYAGLKTMADGASPAMKEYLTVMAFESEDRMARDAALTISRAELAKRAVAAEAYVKQYKDTPERDKVENRFSNYLSAYLIGLDNTPIFDVDFRISAQAKSDFEKTVATYPGTVTAKLTAQLLAVLDKTKGVLFTKDADGMQVDIPEVKAFRDGIEKEARAGVQNS